MGRTTRQQVSKKQSKNIGTRPADIFSFAVATRSRRLIVVSVALFVFVLLFNAGYFLRRFDYLVAEVGAGLTGSEQVVLPDAPSEEPLGPNELLIASVGIRAPIIYAQTVNEDQFQDLLRQGVVHYPETALPGQPGNAFIFGHSSDFAWRDSPYRHVFALLPEMEVGDEIQITDEAGVVYTYVVRDTFIVSPTDMRVLEQGDGSESLLTLQTSYPFGTALARYIVQAKLAR